MLYRLISSIPASISISSDDMIPNGPVSPNHILFLGNPIEVWDPKLNFSNYIQVLEDGNFWQWKVADFISVEGRNYGKWVSDEINLEALDDISPRLDKLRNPPIKPNEPGYNAFKKQVEEFYTWLETIRQPLREQLYELHLRKRKAYAGPSKIVEYDPPLLSKFEDFTVKDGNILTRFHAEPVFFRACLSHCQKASTLNSSEDQLDEIYQERVEAVITAAVFLEAFINKVGTERVPDWDLYESLKPLAKWHLCLLSGGKDHQFQLDREPYQTFEKVVNLRNDWVHYKHPIRPVRRTTAKTITWIEAKMGHNFIESLPNRIRDLIKELCESIDYPIPEWLKSGPGWEV